jgi:adenylate cyclase
MNEAAVEWLERVRDAERRGDHLKAHDLAMQGLREHGDSIALKHRAVLSLARCGSTEGAERLLRELGLAGHSDEDVASLEARLVKDRALRAGGDEGRALARTAAAMYAAVYARTGGYYPGINAATMMLLGGDRARARTIARDVDCACAVATAHGEIDAYYLEATRAEVALVLGDSARAHDHLVLARALSHGDHAAVAATRRQLMLVCNADGIALDVLEPLVPPRVAFYTGHMFHEDERAIEASLTVRVDAHLAARDVGYGHGALACGSDIVFAERLLARGAKLGVVLPFDARDFVAESVAPGGSSWMGRFEACLAAASSVTYATKETKLGDDTLFAYGARLAMGLAALGARQLAADVELLGAWCGAPATGPSGTGADIAYWRSRGLASVVFDQPKSSTVVQTSSLPPAGQRRVARSLLFADVRGFSSLLDSQIPAFVEHALGAFAGALAPHAHAVRFSNTWGDGLYVAFDDVASAATAALELQRAFARVDFTRHGLPDRLALRVGVHTGPVFECDDPVTARPVPFGAHVTRAARIEPITPPGEVYVTEPFAALLALEAHDQDCEYVGLVAAAKEWGTERLYVLRQRQA